MTGIYNLTLDLFYYHLKEGFGVSEEQLRYFDTYWEELKQEYRSAEIICAVILIKKSFYKLALIVLERCPSNNYFDFWEAGIKGILYREIEELGDTNCFFFDHSVDNKDKPYKSDAVTKLKKEINLPSVNDLSLGYTWMVYGRANDSDLFRAELYKELVGEKWQYQRTGKLLGAKVIEAWRSAEELDVPDIGSHVFIILYPDEATYNEASNLIYEGWLPLLLYRHKIWYSYREGKQNKEKARNAFNQAISDLDQHRSYTLQELGSSLEKNRQNLIVYNTNLQNININQQNINTNLYNYNLLLNKITEKANDAEKADSNWVSNLEFLKGFSKITKIKYEKQLEKDYATLAPGLAVLTGLTETIRGLVEVQQAEIDRRSNYIIAIVGLGLAASSAVAGIVATQVYQPDNPKEPPASFSLKNHDIPSNNLLTPTNDRIHWTDGLTYSLVPVGLTALALFFFWLCGISVRAWSRRTKKPKPTKKPD